MLADETCWLLAADFDDAAWRDDVAAFVQTCRAFDVPVAVERSRSGNGAHAWLFFESAMSAATVRTVGSFLITEDDVAATLTKTSRRGYVARTVGTRRCTSRDRFRPRSTPCFANAYSSTRQAFPLP